MAGLFSNLKKNFTIGAKTMIPKLVVCINQVDNLGPWDDAINCPTDETMKVIELRTNDIVKKLSSGSHSASKEQIEHYSALRGYRLPFVVNRIAHCTKAICSFRPVDINDPRVAFNMSKEDSDFIGEELAKRRKKFEKMNVDSLVAKLIADLPKDKAEELQKIYADKKAQPLKVGILGQAGVGKTTTVNNLFNANFKVSRTVVGTDKAQYKDFELEDGSTITIVDLPGYGRSIAEDKEYQNIYIQELKQCDIILLIVQANEKGLADDQYMIECLYEWSKEGLI